tara:strand:+ start:492 stop:608 length:117 start_codon:yes stop_codon:yes gene_type:complete
MIDQKKNEKDGGIRVDRRKKGWGRKRLCGTANSAQRGK